MYLKISCLLAYLCMLASIPPAIDAHKILVIVPMNGKSHWDYMKNFINELLNRGNEVTCITTITMGENQPQNYTEILIDPPFLKENLVKEEDLFKWSSKSPFVTYIISVMFVKKSNVHGFENEKVKKFIHSNDQHFDLILLQETFHDAYLMLAHKFKAPVALICATGIPEFFDSEMGMLTPLAHVAQQVLPYTEKMTFAQRYYSSMLSMYTYFVRLFLHYPWHNGIAQKHFAHLEQPLPSIQELRKNISVIFVNVHRSITYPRPHMPGLVYIGGAHIKPKPKPLPSDLQTFIDGAEHGVIYFSLGSWIKSAHMPKEKLDIFLDTFRKLKQRVIWKFEKEEIANLPKNVIMRKWLPQTDILAHPNIVLFISQGGMFSSYEALHYGIQNLAIPFASDHFRNAILIEDKGIGKWIDFRNITKESLLHVLNEMLTNKEYARRAKDLANIFGDNLVHPMDEFIWWIEHVIKFNGAKYLKSYAADMSLFTYLLLDVMLANLAIVLVILFAFYCLILLSILIKRYLKQKKTKNTGKNKKKQ